jgi:hypothetical protein
MDDHEQDVKNCIDSSVQSHLSTTNSQQRLRATASTSHDLPLRPAPLQHREQLSGFTLSLRRALFPPSTMPHPTSTRPSHYRPWSTLCLKWALLTYCTLSLAILSVTIYKNVRGDRRLEASQHFSTPATSSVQWLMRPRLADRSVLSAFEGISTAQRLSRMSSLQPPFEAFEPYLIQPTSSEEPEDPMAVTACLWSQELEDFDMLYSWVSLWRGMTNHGIVELGPCHANSMQGRSHS